MTYRLSDIRRSTVVEVVSIHHEALSALLSRMGIREGSRLEMYAMAPLGDPVAVHSAGLTIAIRKADAYTIEVKPV